MIPNSLKVSLAVGIVAGAAAALVLADVRDDGRDGVVVHVEGASLTVLADKSDYGRGETVRITLVNSGSVPLSFSDASYGLRVTALDGTLIFAPRVSGETAGAVQQQQQLLQPKEEGQVRWNQQNSDGDQVFDGIYRISVHGFDGGGTRIERTETVGVTGIDLTFGS